MKFLVVADLHQKDSRIPRLNRIAESEGAEAVLFLGDVTDMGTAEDARVILSQFERPVYVIPGNCDPLDLPSSLDGVAVDMHGRAAEVGGIRVAGLGGSNVTIFGTPFELDEDTIYSKLRAVSAPGMLLMVHAPAHGTLDHIPSGASVGSPSIARIVREFRPVAVLSGHIHEDIGIVVKDGTLYMNPGPAMDGYCAVLEVEGGKASARLVAPSECP